MGHRIPRTTQGDHGRAARWCLQWSPARCTSTGLTDRWPRTVAARKLRDRIHRSGTPLQPGGPESRQWLTGKTVCAQRTSARTRTHDTAQQGTAGPHQPDRGLGEARRAENDAVDISCARPRTDTVSISHLHTARHGAGKDGIRATALERSELRTTAAAPRARLSRSRGQKCRPMSAGTQHELCMPVRLDRRNATCASTRSSPRTAAAYATNRRQPSPPRRPATRLIDTRPMPRPRRRHRTARRCPAGSGRLLQPDHH